MSMNHDLITPSPWAFSSLDFRPLKLSGLFFIFFSTIIFKLFHARLRASQYHGGKILLSSQSFAPLHRLSFVLRK